MPLPSPASCYIYPLMRASRAFSWGNLPVALITLIYASSGGEALISRLREVLNALASFSMV